MNIRPFAVLAPIVMAGALIGAQSPAVPVGADDLDAFVQAASQGAAETAAGRVGKDVPFDVAWRRLKAGRAYKAERTGRVEMPTADYGARLDNVLEVPAEYVPNRAWPLRVSLHGGVWRPAPGSGDEPARPLANRIAGGAEFVLHPRAWAQS